MKEKIVFIGGHLVHKFGQPDIDNEDEISSEFLEKLNRGGLSVPTFSTVYFVHSAFKIQDRLKPERAVVEVI